ncbi:MAG: peptidase, partial [Planctomycetota bacterium]|nr:peptidase [Planctomycetota bacterium]
MRYFLTCLPPGCRAGIAAPVRWASSRSGLLAAAVVLLLLAAEFSSIQAARIILKNGMILEGDTGRVGTLISNPTQGQTAQPGGEQIVLVDDDLRRIFVALSQVQEVMEDVDSRPIKFEIPHQPVSVAGSQLGALGRMDVLDSWDRYGRRTVRLRLADGKADIIQGITHVTPHHYRVQTLSGGHRLLLDQRFATSNLPTSLLREILYKAINRTSANDRLRIYQLFLQADRYADAEAELSGIIQDFPKLDLDRERQTVRNLKAGRGLKEIKYRRSAGQHQLAQRSLEQFPAEDIAGATLIEVREILEKYQLVEKRIEQLRGQLLAQQKLVAQPDARELLEPVVQEIHDDITSHTLQRLTAFLQLADDPGTSVNDKLALAVSGWLVGTDNATDNLPVAISLAEVRKLLRAYLTEEMKPRRAALLSQIKSQEAGVPRLVAAVLAHMKPPLPLPEPYEGIRGLHRLTVPGRSGLADTSYLVQLPPEYDPYRRYPAIVTLHGTGTTAPLQIDWWAGGLDERGNRRGQGARHGYIVIAPEWTEVKQKKYQYSSREHGAVLNSLRDACRRFAIDTDRVFLSGHS